MSKMLESTSERQQAKGERVLVAGTPSPRKRKRVDDEEDSRPPPALNLRKPELPQLPTIRASNLLSSLQNGTTIPDRSDDPTSTINFEASSSRVQRDAETLAIIEKLKMGPYDHPPVEGDPEYQSLEPHSNIRLSKRMLPHDDVSDFIRGRYFISPSMIYSLARPSKNRQGYELPVDSEWVTIAVVAERGDIKATQGGMNRSTTPEKTKRKDGAEEKEKGEGEERRFGPKKYVTVRLIDFGSASSDGKGKTVRGDAYLNMMLFEADVVSTARESGSRRVERTYKGGSGGAFERSSKYVEGNVIAVCSPKLLKPYQVGRGGGEKPHPTNNVLGITPTSAESILVIGTSKDLGHCAATRRDGKPCGSWCDRRMSAICDYHLQQAVQSRRSGRAEFSASTMGMTSQSTRDRKATKFDPTRKMGLLPVGAQAVPSQSQNLSGDTGAMYVIGSHVVRPTQGGGDEFVSEKLGREREGKTKRKKEREDTEERLSELLTRDGGLSNGAKAIAQARANTNASSSSSSKKPSLLPITADNKQGKSAFSAEAVKRIGFDPTANKRAVNDIDINRKLKVLEGLHRPATSARLGKRPSTASSVASSSTSLADEPIEESRPPEPSADEESELEIED